MDLHDSFQDSFNRGEPLLPLYQKALDFCLAGRGEFLGDLLRTSMNVISAFAAKGFTFEGAAAKFLDGRTAIDEIDLSLRQARYTDAADRLGEVCATLSQLRLASKATITVASATALPPPPPLRVEVISMPTRVSSTAVDRDSAGRLLGMEQIVRDAALEDVTA